MVKALPWPLDLGRGEEKGSVGAGAGAGWYRWPQFEMQTGAVVSACPWSSVLGLQGSLRKKPFPPQCTACGA